MGLRPEVAEKLRVAKLVSKAQARGQTARERDYGELFRPPVPALPAPVDPQNLPNLTPDERRSIAMRGKTNAMKHGIFSKRAPSMLCDNCYLVRSVQDENGKIVDIGDVKCPYYQPTKACIFMCQALNSQVRDLEDIKTLMEETVELDMQRIQMARAIEVYEGGGVLDQSLDMAVERMGKNMLFLKDFYLQLDDRKKNPDAPKQGILAQLLAQAGVQAVEASVDDEPPVKHPAKPEKTDA